MKWFTDIVGITTAETNIPSGEENPQETSKIQQRTTLLAKIKGTNRDIEGNKNNNITAEEIENFKNSGGSLDEIINKETNETLLDRATKLGNNQAIKALKKAGAKPSKSSEMRAKVNESIRDQSNNKRKNIPEIKSEPPVRSNSGYTTEATDNSRNSSRENSPITVPNEQEQKIDIPPKTWNKASPNAAKEADKLRSTKIEDLESKKNQAIAEKAKSDAATIADKARANKIAKLEQEKNQAIVKPQKTGAEIAERMERQLQERQKAAKSTTPGMMDFSKMKKVGKGSAVGRR